MTFTDVSQDGVPTTADAAIPPPVRSARGRRIGRLAPAWLAVAWLLPLATHALAVDWLIPPLVLLLTAGLLRGGRTLLDRLMLATGLLLGATCAGGLLFTVWPFGMSPIPVAGTALTVLGVISIATGRTPRLPRPRLTDGLTLGGAIVTTWYLASPYLATNATGRLAMLFAAEDNARHASLFDAVRRIGGYAMWQRAADVPDLYEKMRYYPHGWHLVAALLDNFLRSASDELGSGISMVDHYTWFVVGAYGLFAVSLMWAAQWIAGPLLTFWRRVPVIALLGALLMLGDLATLPIFGFVSQILGLTLLTLLVAVLARRPSGMREQIVIIGALLVAIGYSYQLLLPAAGLAVAVWLVRRRVLVRRHLIFVLVAGVCTAAVAAVPSIMGVLYAGHGTLLLAGGGVVPNSRASLLALAALVAAVVLSPAGRRLRVWRSYALTVGSLALLCAGLVAYRELSGSSSSYYLEKGFHALTVGLLAGVGGIVLLLNRPAVRPRGTQVPWPARVRRQIAAATPAVLVAVSAAAVFGVFFEDTPYRPTRTGSTDNLSRFWHANNAARDNGPKATRIIAIDRRYPAVPGTMTVVLEDTIYESYIETTFLSALQRTSRSTTPMVYGVGGPPVEPAALATSLAKMPAPVRVVAMTPKAEQVVAEVRRLRPELHFEVLPAPA